MPSIAKAYNWFVRVDGNHEYLTEKLKAINWLDCKKFIAFLHTGSSKENPHCHFLMELTSELQKQSFDTRVKKHFNVTKKTEFSSKVWDGEIEALAYMYHEDTVPVVNKGFESADLDKAKQHNTVVQKVIAVNNEKASNKLLDKLMLKIESTDTMEDIAGMAVDMIREGISYHPGMFRLKAIVEEAYMKTRTAEDWKYARQSFIRQILG